MQSSRALMLSALPRCAGPLAKNCSTIPRNRGYILAQRPSGTRPALALFNVQRSMTFEHDACRIAEIRF
jgi:hypothetical protein